MFASNGEIRGIPPAGVSWHCAGGAESDGVCGGQDAVGGEGDARRRRDAVEGASSEEPAVWAGDKYARGVEEGRRRQRLALRKVQSGLRGILSDA